MAVKVVKHNPLISVYKSIECRRQYRFCYGLATFSSICVEIFPQYNTTCHPACQGRGSPATLSAFPAIYSLFFLLLDSYQRPYSKLIRSYNSQIYFLFLVFVAVHGCVR